MMGPIPIDPDAHITLYGRIGAPLGYMIRDFLHRSDVPFQWVELRDDQQARELAGVSGLIDKRLPVCVFSDGTRVECPTIRQITEEAGVGFTTHRERNTIWRFMARARPA